LDLVGKIIERYIFMTDNTLSMEKARGRKTYRVGPCRLKNGAVYKRRATRLDLVGLVG